MKNSFKKDFFSTAPVPLATKRKTDDTLQDIESLKKEQNSDI